MAHNPGVSGSKPLTATFCCHGAVDMRSLKWPAHASAQKIVRLSKGMIVEAYVGALLALATSEGVTRLYRWYRPPPPLPVAPAAMPHGYADL